MILAPEARFIFIHVPKAAGTSINSALSLHDVFYPARGRNRAARVQCAAQAGLPESAADLEEHARAKNFIRVLGRETYDSYFSFGFVRNPWDVAVSWFHYRLIVPAVHGHEDAKAAGTFEAYVREYLKGPETARRVGLQHPFLVDQNGDLAVSFVGRYEALEKDFATVQDRLGVPLLPLDRFNESYHAPWPELYTPETFAIVGALVADDARMFGYPADPAAYGIA